MKNIFNLLVKKKKKENKDILKKRKSTEVKPSQFDSSETIFKKEKIPGFFRIVSSEKVGLLIPKELRSDYIILSKSSEEKSVYIISSTEMRSKKNVDNELRTIKQKCSSLNIMFKHYYASRNIIQIIYEEYNSSMQSIKDKNEGYISDFDAIMKEAMNESASDVHFEIRKKSATIRFRKHGEMTNYKDLAVNYGRDLSSVVYQVIAQEKDTSFIETQQQSARIERTIDGNDLNIRLNTLPVAGGFDMVMRLLKENEEGEVDKEISDLGFNEQQLRDLEKALSKPYGVIILGGTTGSGKSTTISTMLNQKMREETGEDGARIKLITVEDPTEYYIVNSSQSGVVRKKGSKENPFIESIRAAMRCDPDLIMVGEVRDEFTAELLVGAVQSGHTAFTTLHASTAIGIIPRLKGFKVGLDVLGSPDFISALINQTLVKVSCKNCNISYEDYIRNHVDKNDFKKIRMLKWFNSAIGDKPKDKIRFRNKKGCDCCTNGISGRSVVAEIILPTPMILSAIERGKTSLAKYYHVKSGGKLILDHGIEKILEGVADPEDIEHAIGPITDSIDMEELAESLGIKHKDERSTLSEEEKKYSDEADVLSGFFSKELHSLEQISLKKEEKEEISNTNNILDIEIDISKKESSNDNEDDIND